MLFTINEESVGDNKTKRNVTKWYSWENSISFKITKFWFTIPKIAIETKAHIYKTEGGNVFKYFESKHTNVRIVLTNI